MRRILPVVAVALVVAALASVAFLYLREQRAATEAVLIPTLDLAVMEQRRPDFSARLIGENNGIPIHYFTAAETATGFTVPTDVHVLFDCPAQTAQTEVNVAHGSPLLWTSARSWGYEYSGNENVNKAAGKRGIELFDGRFWLSARELAVTGDKYGYLNTTDPDGSPMDMIAGKRYYLMFDGTTIGGGAGIRVSCLDSDRDGLNDGLEDANGNGAVDEGETNPLDKDSDDDGIADGIEVAGDVSLDPRNPDSDGDGLQDGTEIGLTAGYDPDTDLSRFIPDADPETTTDPLNPDTDGGGAKDGAEDFNGNGKVDPGENDPNAGDDDAVCASTEYCDAMGEGKICSVELGDCDPPPNCGENDICPDVCYGQCVSSSCGDGIIAGSEECDDGNAAGEDGCSALCVVETGWSCEGQPSVCEVIVPELPPAEG